MERPDTKLEKSLNSLGIFTTDDSLPKGNLIGLRVELPVQLSALQDFKLPEFNIVTTSRRGVKFYFTTWGKATRGNSGALYLHAYTELPTDINPSVYRSDLATSFVDLCWNSGTEELSTDKPKATSELPPGVHYSDLGWYLPARVLDQLIDALGKLNDTFLDGALQDAMLYGIVVP